MTTFPAVADNFELYPRSGDAYAYLLPLLSKLKRFDFMYSVNDPSVNQGQMTSDFDDKLRDTVYALGASPLALHLPHTVPQELDFAFTFAQRSVAVEIEKTNKEKILRDILKCHMYLHFGADFALIALPRNYAHTRGVWNLFDFGKQRYDECRTYGFGSTATLDRILLLGFDVYCGETGEVLSTASRLRMRARAGAKEP